MSARDPLRHHHAHRGRPELGDGVIGRAADRIAEGIGTVQFLIVALVLIVAWVVVNGGYAFFSGAITALGNGRPFDPAPWILLNLIFSFEAFFTGSLVVIAAKASARRDREREAADAKHREELSEMQEQLLGLIHDKVREDTPGGVQAILARLDELFPKPSTSCDE